MKRLTEGEVVEIITKYTKDTGKHEPTRAIESHYLEEIETRDELLKKCESVIHHYKDNNKIRATKDKHLGKLACDLYESKEWQEHFKGEGE